MKNTNKIMVKKASALIQAKAPSLTITQRKVINALIYLAQHDKSKNEFYCTGVSKLKELCDITATDNVNLKKRLKELMETVVEFNYFDKDKKEVWTALSLLSEVSIIDKMVKFTFAPTMKKRIINPSVYSPLDILLVANLSNNYTIVLYEFLRDYLNSPNIPMMTINKLKEFLGVPNEKTYKKFKYFRRDILNKIIPEINKKTDIIVSYKLIKENGNKYKYIRFIVKKKNEFHQKSEAFLLDQKLPYTKYQSVQTKIEDPPQTILKILPDRYRINSIFKLINKYLSKGFDEEYIISNIIYTSNNSSNNFSAYLAKALENDYATADRELQEKQKKAEQERIAREEAEKKRKEEEYQALLKAVESLSEDEYNALHQASIDDFKSSPIPMIRRQADNEEIVKANMLALYQSQTKSK